MIAVIKVLLAIFRVLEIAQIISIIKIIIKILKYIGTRFKKSKRISVTKAIKNSQSKTVIKQPQEIPPEGLGKSIQDKSVKVDNND